MSDHFPLDLYRRSSRPRDAEERRERDLRILRRTTVLLCRAAARCPDPEEAAVTRATERELRALADRWEAEG